MSLVHYVPYVSAAGATASIIFGFTRWQSERRTQRKLDWIGEIVRQHNPAGSSALIGAAEAVTDPLDNGGQKKRPINEQALEDAIENLPLSERLILTLSFYGDKTTAEVGDFLGITEEDAANRIGKAISYLGVA